MRQRLSGVAAFVALLWVLAIPTGSSAGGPQPIATTVRLALTPQGEGRIQAQVVLRDARGQPVAGAPIRLSQETIFGRLPIASLQTDGAGTVVTVFTAKRARTLSVTAAFDGREALAPAKATQMLSLPPTETGSPSAGLTTPSPPPMLALVLTMIVGSVWATYGYVLFLLVQIHRKNKTAALRR